MKMNQPMKPTQNPDDLLTEFADRVLDGEKARLDFSRDEELRGLEETIVRLNSAFPEESLDEKTVARMQSNFKSVVRSSTLNPESRPGGLSRWPRPRMVLTFAAVLTVVSLYLLTPFFPSGTGNVEGSAGMQGETTVFVIALGSVIAILIWLRRNR
jgi:hypothetical protein